MSLTRLRQSLPQNRVRIIGLDPGLTVTGWGIIESMGSSLIYIAHGHIKTNTSEDLPQRLAHIFRVLTDVIHEYQPEEAAVEETFVNKNPASALKLGTARGAVILAPSILNLWVAEYSANKVKKAVVGVGHADKSQVEMMVRILLPRCGHVTKDAADALAVAICHAHNRNALKIQGIAS